MKKISMALVVSVMIMSMATPTMGEVIVETRPFGIDPDTFSQNPDGWFDVSIDDQIIGIYLTNTGANTLSNVQATLTVPANSGIIVTSSIESFGDLPPGVPVLGFFRASFGKSAPGKYILTLDITGDGFSSQALSEIYVSKTILDPNTLIATTIVPEGSTTVEINSIFGGTKLDSFLVPTSLTATMVPSSPFSGQFSQLPFSDPIWKVAGAVSSAFGGGLLLGDSINDVCGVPDDKIRKWIRLVGRGALLAGLIAAKKDGKDPFRRGEENTIPLPSELTTSEVVTMEITYLTEPKVGYPYSAEVTWTFTRYTTGNTYSYGPITETVTNEHSTTSRNIVTDKHIYYVGDEIIITAEIKDGIGSPISGKDAFVHANIEFGENLINVVLRDDGHVGDAIAGDGIYTGKYVILPSDTLGTFSFYVFAEDVSTEQKIGGLLISSPASGSCDLKPDSVNGAGVEVIPEFTTIAIPAAIALGIIFLVFRRKRKY